MKRLLPLLIFFLFAFSCEKEPEEIIDTTAPKVISTTPRDGATEVPALSEIIIEYNEDIRISGNYNITVNGEKKQASPFGKKLKIVVSLVDHKKYTVTISATSIKDIAGNYAEEVQFSFITVGGIIEFNIAENLTTPNPSAEAVNVYNFLKENFGTNIISGTMAAHSTNIDEAEWVHTETGKWPALVGFDYIDHTWLNQNWVAYDAVFNLGSDYWANNGLTTISWHWRDPLTKSGAFYTADTNFDLSKIADVNSDEYAAIIVDIDVIAEYLKDFKDANIPVLWRPLHEAAGGWFWWGAKGAQPCKDLWILMYDRLVNHHGLNNLIWIWTSNTADDALNWYPGDEYVDILSMDIYPGENQHASQYIEFNKIKEIFGGKKLITLSECGSVPDPKGMLEYGDTWSWFMPWNGDFTRSDNHNGSAWWNTFFSYDYVITRDKMPNLKE